ncbi:MAG: FdhF/YdeP family oxidoreductase [Bacteroidetes bacterium]|nr:FdhF/YdeP family oxidoreductase [Bacteroidota bacterium]
MKNKETKNTEHKITKPKVKAGGIPSVVSASKHLLRELSPFRASKVMFQLNQFNGPDCPGCAWPDPDPERSSLGEYCENGAKAIAEEATSKIVNADFFKNNRISELKNKDEYYLGKLGRIAQPVYKKSGSDHYEEVSWDAAFTIIGNKLQSLHSPNEAIFYTSGRTSNEAAFLYQLFVREYGTNNLPDCSNMCHESSGVALTETIGVGKGTVKLEDFYNTDLIIIAGQNPGTNHPRMMKALQKAKANGAKIISINPLKEAGLIGFDDPQSVKGVFGIASRLTDLYLQVRINGDVPLLKAIMFLLLQAEEKNPGKIFDSEFIKKNTHGFDNFIKDLKEQNLNSLSENCGISIREIQQAADLIIKSEKIIYCWAMGLTQHKNAVDNISEIVNLLLLKGSIGKPGAGACPVRGHSNVQGDRTMGIYEKPNHNFLDKLKNVYGFNPPYDHGYDTVDAMKAMHKGKAKVFFAMGGNFLSATPDTNYTGEGLENCELTVSVATKLNRTHFFTGEESLILPCLARTDSDFKNGKEQFVSVENSMGIVHQSKGTLKPVSNKLLSEPEIVCRLAKSALKNKTKIDWDKMLVDYDNIRNEIEKVIPGFENYNSRVRINGGFYLPNSARDGNFNTLTGKAIFTISEIPLLNLADAEYLMMTIRSHDQFNTTIYGMDDRYRGILNTRRVILMNKTDIKNAGLHHNELVNLATYYGKERLVENFRIVEYDITERCVATYFPEANPIIPYSETARKSNTPISKSIIIKILKK